METKQIGALVRGEAMSTPKLYSSAQTALPWPSNCLLVRPLAMFIMVALLASLASSTLQAQFFTLAPGNPSGFVSDAVYGPVFSPPIPAAGPLFPPPGFGPMLTLAPSPPPLPAAPPGTYFIDALSSGNEAGNAYMFSVSPGSAGLAGSPVAMEAFVGTAPSQTIPPGVPGPAAPPEQMGDLFYRGTNFVTGAALPTFGVPAMAGPLAAARGYRDEFALGLNVGDNVASLEMRVPTGGLGASLYSIGMPGFIPAPYTAADIISPLLPFGVPWAPAGALGLLPGDNIDALITQDLAPGPMYTPGIDLVAFSLAPGSPTLGAIGAGPGDLLLAVPAGPPVLFIPGMALGLGPFDDLDAVDVMPLSGDYTGDGIVNSMDYVAWRKTLGMPVAAGTRADGNGDGMVNMPDYNVWRSTYGVPAGAGAGAGAAFVGMTVPEPTSAALTVIGICLTMAGYRSRSLVRQKVDG